MSLARRVLEQAPDPIAGCGKMDHQHMRTDYKTVRPHSSLDGMASAEFPNRTRQGYEDT